MASALFSAIIGHGRIGVKGTPAFCRRKVIMSYLRKVEMSY
jgi:hypothetical protein